jgi:predicted molibdopterin-dependent oxidoreductase YjgC
VRSRRGDVEIKARFTRRISEGTVFIPMHYREAAANVLTNDALDPDVLIPEFKVCAVEIIPLKKKSGKEVAAGAT